MTKDEVIYLIGNFENIEIQRKILIEEKEILENYSGVKSPSMSSEVSSGLKKTAIDHIVSKDKRIDSVNQKIIEKDILLKRFNKALDILSKTERTIVFNCYSKNRKSIKEYENSDSVPHCRTTIYKLRDSAIHKLVEFMSELEDNC